MGIFDKLDNLKPVNTGRPYIPHCGIFFTLISEPYDSTTTPSGVLNNGTSAQTIRLGCAGYTPWLRSAQAIQHGKIGLPKFAPLSHSLCSDQLQFQ